MHMAMHTFTYREIQAAHQKRQSDQFIMLIKAVARTA